MVYLVLSVITLPLTIFVLIYYGYLFRHTDHDVSFFLSVGLISLIMNLFTNKGGVFELGVLYLGLAVLFIGLGFAVDARASVKFYTSIGPWFKKTFTNTKLLGWQILSLVFPAGVGLYFAWYKNDNKRELALECGKCALWGLLCVAVLLWAILGLVL